MVKLIQKKMIDVVYSVDGKEFITPKQLEHEIEDELLHNNGRLNINDLPPILNVSEAIARNAALALTHNSRTIHLLNNELIAEYFLDNLADEISCMLMVYRAVSVTDLTKRFELSFDFIMKALKPRLKRIGGTFDSSTGLLYAESYLKCYDSMIYGRLLGSVRPVDIKILAKQFKTTEKFIVGIFSYFSQFFSFFYLLLLIFIYLFIYSSIHSFFLFSFFHNKYII